MGWSTAFGCYTFVLFIQNIFFSTYMSIRGVSHARMHVHDIA